MNENILEVRDKAAGAVSNMTARARDLGAMAAKKATEAVDGLETASSYLREKNFKHLARDATALIRDYPVQFLLLGIGLAYLLTRGRSKPSAADRAAQKQASPP